MILDPCIQIRKIKNEMCCFVFDRTPLMRAEFGFGKSTEA